MAAAKGRVSAVLLDANGHEELAIAEDEVMPAASVIKLPLVMALYADAAEGRMSLDEVVSVEPRIGGSGVLQGLVGVERMTLRDLAWLAIIVSDNTATNRLIESVGLARMRERLDEWGYRSTRLQRLLFDWAARDRGLENLMTARECAFMLRRIWDGAAAGDGVSADVLTLLESNFDKTRLGRYLPKGVTLAHKDGWGDDPTYVENDAGIVRAKTSAIAVCFTHGVDPWVARPILGILGLAAAEIAGATLEGLPSEVGERA